MNKISHLFNFKRPCSTNYLWYTSNLDDRLDTGNAMVHLENHNQFSLRYRHCWEETDSDLDGKAGWINVIKGIICCQSDKTYCEEHGTLE